MKSSINFCEPDYIVSEYVAEFHNSWSSLLLVYMGFIGYFYGDPLNQMKHKLCFFVLGTIGIGSTWLHGSLSSYGQALDELPMLFMNIALFQSLLTLKRREGQTHLFYTCLIVAVVQSYIYIRFQEYYYIFLINYISSVVVIVIWTTYLANYDGKFDKTRHNLWISSLFSYVVLGSSLWVVEMNYCDWLLPYYTKFNGLSFHILWHLGAGLGTYQIIVFLVYTNLQNLVSRAERVVVAYHLGILPICKIKKNE